jgi:peptide/nickel transport system substrate-binding protein
MNKEPIALYIFRFVVGLGLFAFMIMLYWSSVLVEERLEDFNSDLIQMRSDISSLKGSVDKIRMELSRSYSEATNLPRDQVQNRKKEADRIDSQFPNLLAEDPFYTTTLPQQLGPNFKPHGIFKEAIYNKPDHLHPFANWADVVGWYSLCTASVAALEVGKYETLATDMGIRMELREDEKGVPEYWVFLRKDLFWQPLQQGFFGNHLTLAPFFLRKHPVTAHDFKFFYDAVMNPHVSEGGALAYRTLYMDLEEITVVDDYTFKVKWKTELIKEQDGSEKRKMKYLSKTLTGSLRPLASFVYQYFSDGKKIIENDSNPDTYRINPIWAQNFEHHWAKNIIPSCGPWVFNGMTDREIQFIRNPDFYNPYAALVETMEFKFKSSPDAIWEEFKLGNLDSYDVPPNQLAELERFLVSQPYKLQAENGLGIKRLDYVSRVYFYVGWNEARPLFSSNKVRQALTMAVDRERILRQNLNGMGIQTTGPFFIYSSSYDNSLTPYPYDPQRALQLLHEEGWYDSDGDGVLDKLIDGKRVPFEFSLTYYVKNPTSKSICEYISTALKEIGIICKINGVEVADLSTIYEDKNFDAYQMGWGLAVPPEDPRQLWYSTGAKEKGSSNAIGFANAEVDAIIDQLDYEYDPKKRIELYHRFDKIIYEEAPYIFLYTVKVAKVYREYLQNVFIPADRQDLIPEADVGEPISSIYWIRENQPEHSK